MSNLRGSGPGEDRPWCWAEKQVLRYIRLKAGDDSGIKRDSLGVYHALTEWASDHPEQEQQCRVTHAILYDRTGVSVAQVKRCLEFLRQIKVISWEDQNGRKAPNVYQLIEPEKFTYLDGIAQGELSQIAMGELSIAQGAKHAPRATLEERTLKKKKKNGTRSNGAQQVEQSSPIPAEDAVTVPNLFDLPADQLIHGVYAAVKASGLKDEAQIKAVMLAYMRSHLIPGTDYAENEAELAACEERTAVFEAQVEALKAKQPWMSDQEAIAVVLHNAIAAVTPPLPDTDTDHDLLAPAKQPTAEQKPRVAALLDEDVPW